MRLFSRISMATRDASDRIRDLVRFAGQRKKQIETQPPNGNARERALRSLSMIRTAIAPMTPLPFARLRDRPGATVARTIVRAARYEPERPAILISPGGPRVHTRKPLRIASSLSADTLRVPVIRLRS